jgi:hypothetical protein
MSYETIVLKKSKFRRPHFFANFHYIGKVGNLFPEWVITGVIPAEISGVQK